MKQTFNTSQEFNNSDSKFEDTKITQSIIQEDINEKLNIIENPLDAYEYLRITDLTPIDPPVPIVTINGEIICTEGNISTISGASKSGKSALSGIILAGAISKDGIYDGLDGLSVKPNNFGKAVLHFDTEQARHKHQSNLNSVLRRAKLSNCPDYFLSYNIRELEISKYAETVYEICSSASEKFGGIQLIVIDGIADYINDVNDPLHSNRIIKFFEDLAVSHKTHIILIVHTNPGSEKERGHLGSQCQRKSESVISVKTEGDISYIEPKFLRMAGKGKIPLLQFTYDVSKGYHIGCGERVDVKPDKDAERLKFTKQICMKVFSGLKAYGYKEAIDSIMKTSVKGETYSKNMFTEMKAHQFIKQGDDKMWRLNKGKEIINDEEFDVV